MDKDIVEIWLDLYAELKIFIGSKVQDKQAGEDILQDVFLQVHDHVHTLKDPSRLTAWVYQITRNLIADYFRNHKKSVSDKALLHLAEQEAEDPLYTRLSACINSKIEQLSGNYKSAILLTSFQDYSQKELAASLGISYSGAKTRVQRAREMLKDSLTDCKRVETDAQGNLVDFDHS